MGRPKKNVEVKEEKKEIKRKGRPKKTEQVKSVENLIANEIIIKIANEIKENSKRLDKLEKQVKNIDEDLNTLCDDFYCDGHCEEQVIEKELTDSEWNELLSLIDKKISVPTPSHNEETEKELDKLKLIDEILTAMFN